jgi:anti-sigma regulatory factor (Ser/Thr protein kinase)
MLVDEVATLDNLAELRTHVLRLAVRAGLSEQRAHAFALAVHEAVANALRHAGGCGEVQVVQDDRRRLIAEVRDQGPGMDCAVTLTLPPPEADGGRGRWLVEHLADHVDVHSNAYGTRIRLEMSLRR